MICNYVKGGGSRFWLAIFNYFSLYRLKIMSIDSLKKLVLYSLFIQSPLLYLSKLCKIDCYRNALNIDSTNVFDKMLVLVPFRCNLDTFKCFTFFFMAYIICFSLHNSFKTICTYVALLRCWSLLTDMLESNTSHVTDINEEATPIINSTSCSGR